MPKARHALFPDAQRRKRASAQRDLRKQGNDQPISVFECMRLLAHAVERELGAAVTCA
jgi:hypothetical protein